MSPRARLTTRDYKRGSQGSSLPASRLKDFGAGLAIGLALAFGVYVSDHRLRETGEVVADDELRPKPKAADVAAAEEADAEPAPQYDFYDMLPKFEVVVPERERDVRTSLPAAPVTRSGVYVLQAGSYRNQADAERVRSQLVKQGIDASVQRVQVDADVWHRVRIGPFSDLARLEAARENLRRADVDAIVVRVGD